VRLGKVERKAGGSGRAAWYRLVPGQERHAAPAWNRRAEDAKGRGQGSGVRGQQERQEHRLETCAARILAEMRQTLAAISGGAEQVLGLVDELEAALGPGAEKIEEIGHAGPDLDEP
jgi:hypothetical protein